MAPVAPMGLVRVEVLSVAWREWGAFGMSSMMHRAIRPLTFILLTVALAALTVAPGRGEGEPAARAIDAAALVAFPAHPHSGFSLAVVHAGRLTYEKGFGYRDDGTPDRFIAEDHNYYGVPVTRAPARRAPADGRTIYAIGSVTKQFTAAAILLLAERHALTLDDPVGRYAPEFGDRTLTIRMLLNQRSGLPDLNTLAFLGRVQPLAKRPDGSIDELLVSREIAKLPPDFAPGARFAYSNSNYYVLGTIVERVTHLPLGAFLAANVFEPLGMTRTAFARDAATDDVALGYRSDVKSTVWRAYPWDLRWLGGAGAMTSTVEDLARWNLALLDHRVISRASLAQMWHGIDAGAGQGSYAMGWIEDALGSHRYLWHNGEVGGFHALNVVFPDDGLAFSLLSNNQDARPEFLVPSLATRYFPVSGLDRILPHSGVVLVEASLAVSLGALAIAIVAIVTMRRFILVGIIAAILALVIGFLMPTAVGYIWGGIAALIPIAGYLLVVRFVKLPAPRRADAKSKR